MSSVETCRGRIKESGIVAIFRGDYSVDDTLRMGDALLQGGVRVMEITLNSPIALNALPKLREHFQEEMLIGAGTVRNANQARQARGAGAQFLVSPNLDLETASFAQTNGLLHIPGVLTPTEIQTAFAAGCRLLKLFPMEGFPNGAAYLKAVRAPFQDIDFLPTGGISLENIADYAHAGAVAVGMGSKLVSGADQPLQELTARAKALREAWDHAKHG